MTAPHPLRCETCDHFEGHSCKYLGDRLANVEIVHIERVGCASHSSLTTKAGHCGHECVCNEYLIQCWYGHHKTDKSEPCDMKGVLIMPCPHDTRRQPSAEQRIEKAIVELEQRKSQTHDEVVAAYLSDAIALLRGDGRR